MAHLNEKLEEIGGSGFSLRSAAVALCLTLFLLTSSSYITLKLGALPWPIIFSAIVSGALLNFIAKLSKKRINIHEINVAQAGGTIGGLMAAGITFTIPGIIYLQQKGVDISNINLIPLIFVCFSAGVLGILLSIPIKRLLIDEENLPYPSGTAGAEVVKNEVAGGKNFFLLVITILLIGLFVSLRENYFPTGFLLFSAIGISLLFYPMPMAIGVGYILGKKASLNWFLGAAVGWILIIPYLINILNFSQSGATNLVQNLGMGMVLGSGIGFFLATVLPKAKKLFSPLFNFKEKGILKFTLPASLFSFFILSLAGVPIFASILAVIGAWIMAVVAARTTGETDIDPLEQFGIIIGLAIIGIFALLHLKLDYLAAFIIICFVSIVCALAGDIGHDYKSAKIIGTKARDIVKVDLISAMTAAIFAPFVLEIIQKSYKEILFTKLMPAPQAQLVANSIIGFEYPKIFLLGALIAFFIIIFQKLKKREMPISPIVFGIGMFLGMTLGLLLMLGGLIRYLIDRKFPDFSYSGLLISTGAMGGEGIAGFTLATLFVLGVNFIFATKILGLIFFVLLLITIFLKFFKKYENNWN